MHTVPMGKHKITTSHEDVTLHNVNARDEQSEIWETDTSNCSTKRTNSSCYKDMSSMYHGTWPLDRNIWDAESPALLRMETSSVMSFASSSGGVPLDQLLSTPDQSRRSSQQLEAKVDMVYSLLAMLGGQEHAEMGETLLALSISPESCLAMRQSGCLPLLVQLVQSDRDSEMRKKAATALHNLVESQPDDKARKRETKILRLLEIVTSYTESLENNSEFTCDSLSPGGDKHPVQVISQIMKSSFDEGYRQAICQLGGIHSMAKLIEMEHFVHGSVTEDTSCNLLRKYACMVLTNLTFGDSGNKALLCSYKDLIRTLLMQLQSPNDELRQVTAGILRNLSWRADSTSKEILREVGSVKSLMQAAMLDNEENTLISILSALWNLSAHCTANKSEICSVEGALVFLIRMLSYQSSSGTLAVTENCGGILRNISSQIAGRDDYRNILRKHNCLQILVNHLESTSSTIVSNACGTLWNLSSQNATDQEILWKLGAPSILKNLNKSKHKMIAMGSSATLKNLLTAKAGQVFPQIDFAQPLEVKKRTDQNLIETIDVDLPLDLSRKRPEMEFIEKSGNFKSSSSASLNNMNERNSSVINEKGSQILPSCSSSLPYLNSTKSGSSLTCIPVRRKYAENYEDELESSEEPFDFSRKYSESRARGNTKKEKCSNATSYDYEKPKNENESFSIYAETDLDQPTDYSLRYAENDTDSDSEVCESTEKTRVEFVGDTVKTYCTEGTPYETPFNFSTSTSMSDLRISDKNNCDNDKNATSDSKTKEVLSVEERCVPVQNSTTSSVQQSQASKMKSELSSGLMSPEKPMNYCEEGTPGYFSRVSSFGSLNSSPVCQSENKVPVEMHKEHNEAVTPKVDKIQQKVSSSSEVKVVKFESNVNYCEETPLMFSRSSSLGSLDSIEQHSIHDDRSSVISDFSRLTSGLISPSELPDSPTQTIPPSPKPQKTPEFPIIQRTSGETRSNKVFPKSHVFEDNITKFKEESTPIQYSMATSLSSLTIDDQDDGQIRGLVEDGEKEDTNVNQDSSIEKKENTTQGQSDIPEFYINSRTNISRKTRRQIELTPSSSRKHMSNFQNPPNASLYENSGCASMLTLPPEVFPPPLPVENTVQTYCTEDTPAVLSQNGSISDLSLSTLSMLDEEPHENKVYLTENSSQSSEMNENICRGQSEVKQTKIQNVEECAIEDHVGGSVSKAREEDVTTPPYITATDEVCLFAVEGSPAQFSERSSLSNLTIGSSMMSEGNSFSSTKPTISELGSSNNYNDILHEEYIEQHILNEKMSVVDTSLEKTYTESNQESATSLPSIMSAEVEEGDSVDTLGSQHIIHSANEKNYTPLCEHFENVEPSVVNVETKSGLVSSDSLKKRKWKWKWKFGSDGDEQVYFKEKMSSTDNPSIKKDLPNIMKNEEVNEENSVNMLGSKSLDASYKKKKWWKWKFGAKETEQCETLATDVPKYQYLDIVPQNKHMQEEETDCCSNKESSKASLFARKEEDLNSDIYRDNRNKSKRWKWKWKFSSKDGENSKSEEMISLGLSKLKHSVSPVRKREQCEVQDPLELASLENRRESRSLSITLSSKRFSRSASEPRNRKRCADEEIHAEEVHKKSPMSSTHYLVVDNSIQVEQTEEALALNKKCPGDISGINNFKESLDPEQTAKSCTNDKSSMTNCSCEKYSEPLTGDVSRRKPDFAALIEECIQLGMPKKKEIDDEAKVNSNASSAAPVISPSTDKIKVSSEAEHYTTSFDHMAILEKCIKLCMPKTKDEIESNAGHVGGYALNYYKERCDMVDPAIFDECVEMSKKMQKSKETIISKISRTLQQDKSSEVSVVRDDYSTSSIVRNISSSRSHRYKEISKNDLEFLRRQLNIADKRLLQEALARGIPKEEEAFLIELLIMKRVMTEARQSEKRDYTNSCFSNTASTSESDPSKDTQLMSYSEEPLDPVTLSIVKHILHRNFQDCENNLGVPKSMEHYKSDSFDADNSGNYNFEIILEERIRVTSARNQEIENISTASYNRGDYNSASRVQDRTSSIAEHVTRDTNYEDKPEQYLCPESSGTRKLNNSSSEECVKPVEITESVNCSSCKNSNAPSLTKHYTSSRVCNNINQSDTKDHTVKRKCSQPEFSSNTVSENSSADNILETVHKNEIPSNSHRDYAALVEECIQLGMPKKKEVSEDCLYVNISEVPGNSRCHSLKKHKTTSRSRSEINENTVPKTCTANIVSTDAKALVEECIMLGMPKKNDTLITNTAYKANSSTETTEVPSISKVNEKADFKSLLEECIQLGMPKKKEVFSETRSSSPKICPTNPTRIQSVIPTSPSVRRSNQYQMNDKDLPETKENPEEAIYANITATAGYSRLLPAKATESKTIQKKGSCDKQQDYSALINECIKLGMPCKNKSKSTIVHEKTNPNEISSNKSPNYEELIEECIQLGMPKRKELSEDAIYANTLERYSISNTSPTFHSAFTRSSSRRMLRSDSEPGPNKIQRANDGNSRSGSVFPPHYSSMDTALEECIQLGWPKNKEMATSRRTIELTAVSNPSRMITVEKIKEPQSKNVNVASVVRNTPEYQRTCFRTLAMATGAEDDSRLPGAVRTRREVHDMEKIQSAEQEKNGYKYIKFQYPLEWMTESIKLGNETENGSEMSFAELADVDAKLLDPEAMLKALDTYTAELISEAELRLKLQNTNL